MTALIDEMVRQIRDTVSSSAGGLVGPESQLRRAFYGPPMEFLEEVFEQLIAGEGLQVTSGSGSLLKVPVVLQVEELVAGSVNPAIDASGKCLPDHVLDKRNSPGCPCFLVLVPPGRQAEKSIETAVEYFGLAQRNNSGGATIEEWWNDNFVQAITRAGIARGLWKTEQEKHEALMLAKRAIFVADEANRHDASRLGAWNVISRIFSLPAGHASFGKLFSLACGFPPLDDGSVSHQDQERVLRNVADAIVPTGFRPGIARLKEDATKEDIDALDGLLGHLQEVCDVQTAFETATAYYYAPSQGGSIPPDPPSWWSHLTVERWMDLLLEDRQLEGAVSIECTNSVIPARKGIPALVLDKVELSLVLPERQSELLECEVVRETGAVAKRASWKIDLEPNVPSSMVDESPPSHRAPIRYSTNAPSMSKAGTKVISLAGWEAGVFAFCQTANKIAPPKKAKSNREKVVLEASLDLTGVGRHYIDLFVQSGISVSSISIATDTAGVGGDPVSVNAIRVSDNAYGFEIDATSECHCDVSIDRGNGDEILRLNFSCDEVAFVGCASEFERLIAMNRPRTGGRVTNEVEINRQVRCVDLQTWMLDPKNADSSFLPVVIGPDLSENWRDPKWGDLEGSILSRGKFLHDPRPRPDRMQAPPAFVEARRLIAERIRGQDGSGLVETAKLGEWLSVEGGDAEEGNFAELLDKYLSAFSSWLEADPAAAAWVDVVLVASIESDGMTIVHEPDAILISPLHPMRLAWQALAQKSLYQTYRAGSPCPAASVLDAGRIPDLLALPISTASGSIKSQPFISVECNSDYWSVLWNGSRLGSQSSRVQSPPFDKEFGLVVGGASSGFSVSQVRRALNDVTTMLAAKPVISVAVSSASGQNNACDEGLLSWCRDNFGNQDEDDDQPGRLGPKLLQVFDDRPVIAQPDETSLANLAEDTSNSVRWFKGLVDGKKPDLGIIAQLESASPSVEPTDIGSPVGQGALVRHRTRKQLPGGNQAFLSESRMGVAGPPSGDGLSDRLMNCVVRLENMGASRLGYSFAPSVHAIQAMLKDKCADFVAVSSAAVDPACFLGGWLNNAYLWDFHLPSYSQRSGDTNGYYLLSQVKDIDRDTFKKVLSRLPGGEALGDDAVKDLLHEVARRGIPTIRGLSSGDSGATGDLGLFIAARLLQDEFREEAGDPGILPVLAGGDEYQELAMVVPVDPFQFYIEDLQRALGKPSGLRPDFLVVGIQVTDSLVKCKLTPVEVKYRNGPPMSAAQRLDALAQARALSDFFTRLQKHGDDTDLLLWRLSFQHLLTSMLSYGFRVYSQQRLANARAGAWSALHERTIASVLSGEIELSIDEVGRLIVVDSSPVSEPRDLEGDGFRETIVVSPQDAAKILFGVAGEFYGSIRAKLATWNLLPERKEGIPTTAKQGGSDPSMGTGVPFVPLASNIKSPTSFISAEVEVPLKPHESELVKAPSQPTLAPALPISAVGADAVASAERVGINISVGTTVDTFQDAPRYLNLSSTELNQLNIGVVGDLGTGKTQFLKSLIYQVVRGAAENSGIKPRFLIFDYKKDYGNDDFVNATGARVQSPSNLPLNLFDISGAAGDKNAWLRRYQFFSDVLDKIYSGIGPVQRQQLKKAVKAAYDECQGLGRQPTIYDVHQQYEILLDGKVDSIFGILDDLVDMELFAREPGDGMDFSNFLDGVVVIQLNELGSDDRTKNMLVAVMLNMFYEHMLTIPKRPYTGSSPQLRVIDSFLLVDEADNIMKYEFDVLRKVLLQGREFGVGVILASQFLSHFKVGATDYREMLLSWFVHKVPKVIPQDLSALGLAEKNAQLSDVVKLLPNHHCLMKTYNVSGEVIDGMPFYKLISKGT